MIKVEIKNKQGDVINKTYDDRMDLCWDLKFILDFPLHKNYREDLSNKICDLNFDKTYKIFGYEFKLITLSKPQPKLLIDELEECQKENELNYYGGRA